MFAFYAITYGSKLGHNQWVLAITLGVLCLVVGCSDMLGGYDRYIYAELFDETADQITKGYTVFSNDLTLYGGYKSEFAYVIWNDIVAHVTENRYIFILLTTIFIYAFIFKSIRDYVEDNYLFAVMVFMGIWFFFSFTYIRQAMAVSVAWFSMRYVIRRKPIPFFICAIIAFLFHNSAIVFFPIYFIPIKKWDPRSIVITMAIFLFIGIMDWASSLYSVFDEVSDLNRNKGYDIDDTGGRIAYLIEVVIFLFFLLHKYDDITTDKDIVFLNSTLCFCGLLLVFFRSSNAGRLSWYFMIGLICLFTKLATHNEEIDGYNIALLGIIFALYLRIVIAWGGMINPYKTFFTEGYRSNDPIIEQYEYDWNYEAVKMYRRPLRIVWGDWR